MAMASFFFFFFFLVTLLSACVELSEGGVYKVGDTAGWTILGNVNYTAWASKKTFQVGDTIVFVYNKQFHNVMEVSRANYRLCNTALPIVTYSTGNDSIRMERKGHHFFICGVPGHCAAGQKVDIRIPKLKASSSSSSSLVPPPSSSLPSKSPPPPSSHSSFAPGSAPNTNHASPVQKRSGMTLAMFVVTAAVYGVLLS